MMMIDTPEQKELKKIFKPYMEGAHMRENAPLEAVQALEKYQQIFEQRREAEVASWFEDAGMEYHKKYT